MVSVVNTRLFVVTSVYICLVILLLQVCLLENNA